MIACKSDHKDEHNHSEHNQEEGNHEGHDHGNEENDAESNHEGHDHGNEENDAESNHEGHDHGKKENDKEEHSEHTENEIHLTPEQFKSAKIKIGSIEKRSVRERIEVTGTIQAPPKNKATVYEDQEHLLKVGTFINAQILLGGKLSHSVPEQAIVDFEGKKIIFKAESVGEFIPLEVTLGNSYKGFSELKTIHDDNFKVNVVTKGAHFLKGELLKSSGEMNGHAHAHTH